MKLSDLMPDGNFEESEFLRVLHDAQSRLGRSHEAVQEAIAAIDPNYDHAMQRDPDTVIDIVSRLKMYVDEMNWWNVESG